MKPKSNAALAFLIVKLTGICSMGLQDMKSDRRDHIDLDVKLEMKGAWQGLEEKCSEKNQW